MHDCSAACTRGASTGLAVGLAAALLAVDLLAWRVVAAMFDRERLVTGRRA
jgi:ABC-2 type transport system permease protein